ncbi:glyoxalase superfamily protein [Aestuariivita boseongensis]|uniref:glyoxalase superfamily protein n=1 Tax=Aestuariivita boseongensis TaxID=1470562 RepID=UPI000680A2F3|nr:glyoxalase superfamily protein [Aestuariivita boseongensis]
MKHSQNTPSVSDLKDQARRLRQALADQGTQITHSRSLELLAQQYGAWDWNTLRAWADTPPPPATPQVGSRVTGRYLGQPFAGVLKSLSRRGAQTLWHVAIQLDQPIDVVSFDSFSSWRRQITGTVDQNGRSLRHRSDGTPHLVVEWSHD